MNYRFKLRLICRNILSPVERKFKKYFLFSKLVCMTSLTWLYCYLNIELSDSFYNSLYDTINDNKCLAIKFSQWILSRLNIT